MAVESVVIVTAGLIVLTQLVDKLIFADFAGFLKVCIPEIQILTQEDWNMVLFNGMAQTNPWAALYFVALMTFGNYVLFNLLVAILVEGFQESKEEEKRQQVRFSNFFEFWF